MTQTVIEVGEPSGRHIQGSVAFVLSVAGLVIAEEVIQDLKMRMLPSASG